MKAFIEAQGSLLTMRVVGSKKQRRSFIAKRGKIRGFSYKSRLRLLRFMARLRMLGVRATFITLTYRGYPSNAQAKRNLHAFLEHIRRCYPSASCVWRMEYQSRGSIHFHLLCFNLPYWDWKEILATWKGITDQDISRIDVRLVRSRRGVMSYVAKYIAKVERRVKKTFLVFVPYLHKARKWRKGRFWGYHNKKALPLGEKIMGVLLETKGIKQLAKSAWEIIGYETRFGSLSFHLFVDHAISIAIRNIEAFGLFSDEFTWSRHVEERWYEDQTFIRKHFSERDIEASTDEALGFSSRPRSAQGVQPCTKNWLHRASFSYRAAN
jgi:hypothetical protein